MGFVGFISDPRVLQTAVGSMVITSFCAALPKPGTPFTWVSLYRFAYTWLLGFWSLKTGHPVEQIVVAPIEVNSKAGNEQ